VGLSAGGFSPRELPNPVALPCDDRMSLWVLRDRSFGRAQRAPLMVKMRKWASGRQNLHIMNDDYICTFLIDADISICGLLKILKYQTVIFIHPYVMLCYLLSF
jgi:hypothetical protein